jgi:hypothetical protein
MKHAEVYGRDAQGTLLAACFFCSSACPSGRRARFHKRGGRTLPQEVQPFDLGICMPSFTATDWHMNAPSFVFP